MKYAETKEPPVCLHILGQPLVDKMWKELQEQNYVIEESKKPCPHGKGIKFDCSFCALEFLNILIEERKAINH